MIAMIVSPSRRETGFFISLRVINNRLEMAINVFASLLLPLTNNPQATMIAITQRAMRSGLMVLIKAMLNQKPQIVKPAI